MVLGALVDAGVSLEELRGELAALAVPGWAISAEKVWKNGMSATYVKVQTEDTHTHRSLSAILDIFAKSSLPLACRIAHPPFSSKLGAAEASVHDVPTRENPFS